MMFRNKKKVKVMNVCTRGRLIRRRNTPQGTFMIVAVFEEFYLESEKKRELAVYLTIPFRERLRSSRWNFPLKFTLNRKVLCDFFLFFFFVRYSEPFFG